MILNKLVNSAVRTALAGGIIVDVKSKNEDPLATNYRYGVDAKDGDKITIDLGESKYPEMPMVRLDEIEIDRYKVPFFFVTGLLIGVAFGLRHGKVVVLR